MSERAGTTGPDPECVDVLIVGAGAAGLAAAIFTARSAPGLRIRCVDGARKIGAKILVSGGSRCNVTNRVVTDRDFWGGPSSITRNVLRAFPAERAARFFEELGVRLHEEEDGKLFPDSHRSRTVLDALLAEVARRGISIDTGERVDDVRVEGARFIVTSVTGRAYIARRVVLATGGRSLPKTGSDGFGYELARRLGHGSVETSPALAPLVLAGEQHDPLSGVSQDAVLTIRANGGVKRSLEGPMLWTHTGISGPVALNMSRHWHRAEIEGRSPRISIALFPGETQQTLDVWLLAQQTERPRALVRTVIATRLPGAVADAWTGRAAIDGGTTMAHLTREDRRRLVQALLEFPLEVVGSRGYSHAEVTAGGVPLDEIDPATMGSRVCPGLHLVGEILDVDGRLGGFNFQWAWSSGWVAGWAIARDLRM